MNTKALMVVGSMSSVGKSFLVTGLCRLFAKKGIKVAPFKSQNMSNNAAVCKDGGEIARAQYLQAIACGIEPNVQMNPILLKPHSESKSQVVVLGKVQDELDAKTYHNRKQRFWEIVKNSLDSLMATYDLVIIEGAGSPVELNLKQSDIVNMSIAKYAKAHTFIVGDIDRGGIFAQLLGTYWLLRKNEQKFIKGFIINKFRGDIGLFKDGMRILQQRSGVPVIGIMPYLNDLNLPQEDAALLGEEKSILKESDLDICIVSYPHVSNFDDFDVFKFEKNINVRFVKRIEEFGKPDIVILPGSKNTISDLIWLRKTGLADLVLGHAKSGKDVVGICGGYQMLGKSLCDEYGIEGGIRQIEGLGLLDIVTHFEKQKSTFQVKAKVVWEKLDVDEYLLGYEIHMGRTHKISTDAIFKIIERNGQKVSILDGTKNTQGNVWGTYIHGIFNNDKFRSRWLSTVGYRANPSISFQTILQQSIDRLADEIERNLDVNKIMKIIGL